MKARRSGTARLSVDVRGPVVRHPLQGYKHPRDTMEIHAKPGGVPSPPALGL